MIGTDSGVHTLYALDSTNNNLWAIGYNGWDINVLYSPSGRYAGGDGSSIGHQYPHRFIGLYT